MTTTYIHHSCFLAETTTCYYLFDYEKGTLPAMDVTKPIFVLSSHAQFVVLDPRQEKNYDRGLCYFLEHIPAAKVYPMH